MSNTLKALLGSDILVDDTTKRALFDIALEALKDTILTLGSVTGQRMAVVDKAGNHILPFAPVLVAATGQKLTCSTDKTDYNVTVVAGGTYRIFADNGRIHVGVAAVAAGSAIVDADVLLTVPAGGFDCFQIPAGQTTLHYATDSGAGITGRIARLA